MNCYELLVDKCCKENIEVVEKKFKSKAKGLWKNNRIGISNQISTISEKYCILAEEYAHYKTTYGNITNLKDIRNLKQENKARAFAIESICSLDKIIDAIKKNASNKHELIEILNITEELFDEAVAYYSRKQPKYSKDSITLYFNNQLLIYREYNI